MLSRFVALLLDPNVSKPMIIELCCDMFDTLLMEGLDNVVQVAIPSVGIPRAMNLRRHVDFSIDIPWLPFLSNFCTMDLETHCYSL